MKRNFAALLLAVLLVLTAFGTVACDNNPNPTTPTVKEISLVAGSLKTEYTVGDSVDLTNAKIKVTMSDGTSAEVALTQSMLNAAIDTTKAGSTTYTITYEGKTCQITITVGNPSGVIEQVETFSLPQFVADYEEKTKEDQEESDSSFKLVGSDKAVYEVGNANKFILNPVITGFDSDDKLVTQSEDVQATFALAVCDTADGTFVDVASADLANYVSAENNMYKFTTAAAGKFFKLTVSLDASAYTVGESVTTSRTMLFKVVNNGYNVYDQDGLAVMTDMINPEFWADILGCTVDSNGAYVAGATPLTLAADDKPLYQYIGTVDWIILHGSITIDADKLPANYFWNDNYQWCKDNRTTAESSLKAFESVLAAAGVDTTLNGTLIDGNGAGYAFAEISKNNADDNNNHALYCTNRVSVSGNYNSISLPEGKSEGGRLLKVLVSKNIAGKSEYPMGTNWHLFKLFQEKASTDGYTEVTAEFTVKNIALSGNAGKNENVGPQGLSMINNFAKITTVQNIVANKFCSNFGMDNYAGSLGSDENNILNISSGKIYDTYNAMAITWRCKINITDSMLKDAGGPLFILMDGTGRELATDGNDISVPTVTVDALSELSSFSMGNEAWFTQLGEAVPQMFASLQTLSNGLQQISGKSFFTSKTVGTTTQDYASILSILIPDDTSALGDNDFNNYKFTGVFKTATDEASMLDEKFRGITDNLAAMNLGTVVIKSGSCYAFVWQDTNGNQVLVSYDMLATLLYKYTNGLAASPYFDTTSTDYLQGMAAMAQDWRTNSTDIITVWLQAQTGVSTSPYIGIVIGGFHTAEK